MLAETTPAKPVTLLEIKKALIETALKHEQVAAFTEYLNALLAQFGRQDVKVVTQTTISERGVHIKISIYLDSLYPGQASREPDRNLALKQAEQSLLDSLRSAGVNIGSGGSIGRGDKMQNFHSLFDVVVGFDGVLSTD